MKKTILRYFDIAWRAAAAILIELMCAWLLVSLPFALIFRLWTGTWPVWYILPV